MTLYTRHQLLLILVLTVAAGAGLAIDHWRRARPELVARLEALDRGRRPEAISPSASRSQPHPTRPQALLDVNRASEGELGDLPGVGPALAARIVAARPFASVDELRRVPGMRRAVLERVRPRLAVDP
jgi:DNA uptake protein ComE-like DNA-binding protein